MAKAKGAYVTLLSGPSYLPGTLVLNHSLRAAGAKYPLVVMASANLPQECLDVLALSDIKTMSITRLAPKIQGSAVRDERFADTWCKLVAFQLTQFERVVLLDSDMLIRKNIDELVEMPLEEGWIAAAHVCACNPRKLAHYPKDWIRENCAYSSSPYPPAIKEDSPRPYTLLNSGTVVLTPSTETFEAIGHYLETSPLVETFQFPDQDLLAEFFRGRWKPISYVYNALKTLRIAHKDLWNNEEVKCVHYILGDKPWTYRPKEGISSESVHHELNQWWWEAYYAFEKQMKTTGLEQDRKYWDYVELYVAN